MQLIFATHNQHKANELKKIIPVSIDIRTLAELEFTDDIEETELTIEGNALLKADYIFKKFKLPCFADDTGLEVEVLNGDPGVFSARYAGNQKSDKDNVEKLLLNLQDKPNRKARFKTIIAYCSNTETHLFEGIINGTIADQPAGTNGFGYDPVFIPDGYSITFAQMDADLKNKISHRSIAVAQLVTFLKNIG